MSEHKKNTSNIWYSEVDRNTIKIEEVSPPMITQTNETSQLPDEINRVFRELKVFQHLRKAGITKSVGFTCSYLFQLVFSLVFHSKNWFRLLDAKANSTYPAKDAVYRFLNCSTFAWRSFLTRLSTFTTLKAHQLTSAKRVKVLIVDDSAYERNRSKKVELLSRCFEHTPTKNRYYRGFRMLTLGWSDGHSFLPADFALLGSPNSLIHGMDETIDKRTSGYRRRLEALQPAPQLVASMVKRALDAGVQASYVLMDTWFTHEPLILSLKEIGMEIIGMINDRKQRYQVKGSLYTLKQLYAVAAPVQNQAGILRSVCVQLKSGLPAKIVFIQNRNKKSEWLAILSTDLSLAETEIVRIYGMRWDIEVFFKSVKSLLRLQKEFQGRSFDALISHTTIVFARYIVLSWQHRCSRDPRTLGGLFYELCDEVSQLDWAVALRTLLDLLEDVVKQTDSKVKRLIKRQLQQWIDGLPSYIKAYLAISTCES